MSVRTVELHFDFVSPYTYLALTQVEAFGDRHGVDWIVRPVVYGALLSATGLIGPAEVPVKRRYTFRDVTRTARLLGVPMVGPPAHPFRSLEALRTVCAFADRPQALPLSVSLAHAAWGEGRDLTDVDVLADVVGAIGLNAEGLVSRISAPEIKRTLRTYTEEALAAGVFGVPTFRLGRELFWGHDRLPQLAARLEGRLDDHLGDAEAMEARPRGTDRRGSPARVEE